MDKILMRTKQILLIIILLPIALGSLILLKNMVKKDYELYQKEGECISALIKAGVERKDILTSNGICNIKERS